MIRCCLLVEDNYNVVEDYFFDIKKKMTCNFPFLLSFYSKILQLYNSLAFILSHETILVNFIKKSEELWSTNHQNTKSTVLSITINSLN